ncbi:MAG TPA: nicotinamide-nucleotide amidohydrolase family protein [Opitutaceae bacterium]|nr:nicotinamide-nucleotide amidohydrolase family protein [Opitutaceae bacterium]
MNPLKPLMLADPRLTLAVAESMSCGQVQARIGAISGASEFFLGGITTYSIEQKVRHLGVNRAAAKKVNSVSVEIAEQMAAGVCRLFGSDLGIATTGYAEAAPAEKVAEPFAWWALVRMHKGRVVHRRHGRIECPGESRGDVQAIVAEAAVAELVEYLRELRG